MNLLLIYTLVKLVISYLAANQGVIIGCGLAAYVGKVPADLANMKILGIMNEERGTHSCGICINDTLEHGVLTKSSFRDFVADHEMKYSQDKNFTVLIHTRQATHGQKIAKNAHPFGFILEKDRVVQKMSGEFRMVGIHNGKLDDWQDLRKKMELPTEIDLDSKVLLGSISKDFSFEVLKHYQGAAALIFYRPEEPNVLYCYKGCNDNDVEERPLYFKQIKEKGKVTGMYLSSIKSSLDVIKGKNSDEIKTFQGNTVYKIEEGRIVSRTKIKREKPKKKEYSYNRNTSNSRYPQKYEDNDYFVGAQQTSLNLNADKSAVKIWNQKESSKNAAVEQNKVYFWMTRYWCNKTRIDGMRWINTENRLLSDKNDPKAVQCYFWNGILIKSKKDYETVKKNFKKDKNRLLLIKYSQYFVYPTIILDDEKNIWNMSAGQTYTYYNTKFFQGKFWPIFSNKEYFFEEDEGWLSDIKFLPDYATKTTNIVKADMDEKDPLASFMAVQYIDENPSNAGVSSTTSRNKANKNEDTNANLEKLAYAYGNKVYEETWDDYELEEVISAEKQAEEDFQEEQVEQFRAQFNDKFFELQEEIADLLQEFAEVPTYFDKKDPVFMRFTVLRAAEFMFHGEGEDLKEYVENVKNLIEVTENG